VFRERVRPATEADRRVLDGNYLQHQQDISWPVADTIVWLDLASRSSCDVASHAAGGDGERRRRCMAAIGNASTST
jgi:hypothetical protein